MEETPPYLRYEEVNRPALLERTALHPRLLATGEAYPTTQVCGREEREAHPPAYEKWIVTCEDAVEGAQLVAATHQRRIIRSKESEQSEGRGGQEDGAKGEDGDSSEQGNGGTSEYPPATGRFAEGTSRSSTSPRPREARYASKENRSRKHSAARRRPSEGPGPADSRPPEVTSTAEETVGSGHRIRTEAMRNPTGDARVRRTGLDLMNGSETSGTNGAASRTGEDTDDEECGSRGGYGQEYGRGLGYGGENPYARGATATQLAAPEDCQPQPSDQQGYQLTANQTEEVERLRAQFMEEKATWLVDQADGTAELERRLTAVTLGFALKAALAEKVTTHLQEANEGPGPKQPAGCSKKEKGAKARAALLEGDGATNADVMEAERNCEQTAALEGYTATGQQRAAPLAEDAAPGTPMATLGTATARTNCSTPGGTMNTEELATAPETNSGGVGLQRRRPSHKRHRQGRRIQSVATGEARKVRRKKKGRSGEHIATLKEERKHKSSHSLKLEEVAPRMSEIEEARAAAEEQGYEELTAVEDEKACWNRELKIPVETPEAGEETSNNTEKLRAPWEKKARQPAAAGASRGT
eukprot:GHVU01002912.1.p1 GENE.GHVU01002912.1~~GHVU01002912.1.p1  ORF type:complete len:664 (+),score=97.58 GHVU01002912.1:232-1992(+)